jgi:hypothetical protein
MDSEAPAVALDLTKIWSLHTTKYGQIWVNRAIVEIKERAVVTDDRHSDGSPWRRDEWTGRPPVEYIKEFNQRKASWMLGRSESARKMAASMTYDLKVWTPQPLKPV